MIWGGLIHQLKASIKWLIFLKERPTYCFWTQTAGSTLHQISSLLAYPADCGLASFHNHVSQFLKISLSPSPSPWTLPHSVSLENPNTITFSIINISVGISVHVSLYAYGRSSLGLFLLLELLVWRVWTSSLSWDIVILLSKPVIPIYCLNSIALALHTHHILILSVFVNWHF